MYWRRVGVALSLWGVLGGATALGMAFIPDEGTAQKADWAIECFNGSPSACSQQEAHAAALAQWRERAWTTGGVSAVIMAVGLSLIAGGRAPQQAAGTPSRAPGRR